MFDQLAIDRITELENLTDNLEDDDANWLIDWGVAHAKAQLATVKDEDAAQEKIGAVIAVMRQLNRLVGDHEGDPADILERLQSLITAHEAAFGKAGSEQIHDTGVLESEAKTISTLASRDLMKQVLDFINPPVQAQQNETNTTSLIEKWDKQNQPSQPGSSLRDFHGHDAPGHDNHDGDKSDSDKTDN